MCAEGEGLGKGLAPSIVMRVRACDPWKIFECMTQIYAIWCIFGDQSNRKCTTEGLGKGLAQSVVMRVRVRDPWKIFEYMMQSCAIWCIFGDQGNRKCTTRCLV